MSAPISIDSRQFRRALGAFATGVTVITTVDANGKDVGLTANSFNSVSLDPPMILWSLDKKSSNFNAFMGSEYFAVHVLSAEQDHISNQFAKSGVDRFAGMDFQRGVGSTPLLEGCSAWFVCRMAHRYEGGDHFIIVGEVLSYKNFEKPPLVFHSGKYGMLLSRELEKFGADKVVGIDWLGFLLRRAYDQLLTPLRKTMSQYGINDVHYHVISILAMGDRRSKEELLHLVRLTGLSVRESDLEELVHKDFLCQKGQSGAPVVSLTQEGRRLAIELVANGMSLESDALKGFNENQIKLLKTLILQLTENTSSNVPVEWRKENYWHKNNILGGRGNIESAMRERKE